MLLQTVLEYPARTSHRCRAAPSPLPTALPFHSTQINPFVILPHPPYPPGDALIVSRWPAQGAPSDEAALSHFELLKGCVRQLRNARAEYNVEPGRRVGATVVVEDAAAREVGRAAGGCRQGVRATQTADGYAVSICRKVRCRLRTSTMHAIWCVTAACVCGGTRTRPVVVWL